MTKKILASEMSQTLNEQFLIIVHITYTEDSWHNTENGTIIKLISATLIAFEHLWRTSFLISTRNWEMGKTWPIFGGA